MYTTQRPSSITEVEDEVVDGDTKIAEIVEVDASRSMVEEEQDWYDILLEGDEDDFMPNNIEEDNDEDYL